MIQLHLDYFLTPLCDAFTVFHHLPPICIYKEMRDVRFHRMFLFVYLKGNLRVGFCEFTLPVNNSLTYKEHIEVRIIGFFSLYMAIIFLSDDASLFCVDRQNIVLCIYCVM